MSPIHRELDNEISGVSPSTSVQGKASIVIGAANNTVSCAFLTGMFAVEITLADDHCLVEY
jgi:DUF971 family protein